MVWTIYAACLALFLVFLSIRTLLLRRRTSVELGLGSDVTLIRAIRAHGNFSEYAPLGILLLIACEAVGASALVIHGLGSCLLLGRSIHALGISREPETMALRVTGMALTLGMLCTAAAYVLWVVRFPKQCARGYRTTKTEADLNIRTLIRTLSDEEADKERTPE